MLRQSVVCLCSFQRAELICLLLLFYPGKGGDSWFPSSGQRLQLRGFSCVDLCETAVIYLSHACALYLF